MGIEKLIRALPKAEQHVHIVGSTRPETLLWLAAYNDHKLLDYLLKLGITIEACPISNVKTGVVPSLEKHPIRAFFDQGLKVTVNTDDPSMFGTDMNNEYLELHRKLGFTVPELFKLSLNAIDSSFLLEERKIRMRESFLKEYRRLLNDNCGL